MDDLELIKATFHVLDECAENIKNAGAGIASIEDNFPKPSNPEWFSDYEDLKSYLDSLKTATGIVGNHFKTFAENLELVSANYKTTESLIEEVGVTYITTPDGELVEATPEDNGPDDGVTVKKGEDYDLDPYDPVIDGDLSKYEGEKLGLDKDKYYKLDEDGNRVEISKDEFEELAVNKESFLGDHVVLYGDGVSVQKALGHYGDTDALQVDAFEGHAYAQWKLAGDMTLSGAAGVGVSMLDISGEGKIGGEYLNFHGDYDVKVCAADASVSISAGPHGVSAEAKAEAVLVSASGTAGFDVLGVDAEVSGGVGLGLGASAKGSIDWETGKISFGASAYVGIGGDFSIDFDASTLVNGIKKGDDIIQSFGETAREGWENVTGFFTGFWS